MKEASMWLARIREKAVQKGVDAVVEIAEHDVSTYLAIVDHASKAKVDLIVIGSRGFCVEGVVAGVVTYATCPVRVVR